MDRDVKFFVGLIICTVIVAIPFLPMSESWWVLPLSPLPMVVREWKPVPPPNPMQLTASSGSNVDPVWSSDNWHLAFASNRFGNWSIWTMCEDGTKQKQLTANNTNSRYPAWSPDGSRIAYLASVKGQWDLWVMCADGTGKTKLTTGPAFEGAPQWSPDGKLILFTKQQPRWNVWVTCGDGVYQAQLTKEGDNLYPSWSSDGKQVIFSSNRSGNWDIWMMNADGTSQTQLTKASGDNIKPQLSPNGKTILFLSNRLGHWGIWTMNQDESYPFEVISVVAEDGEPTWSPDGKTILFHVRWVNDHFVLRFDPALSTRTTIFMASAYGTNITAISAIPGSTTGISNELQAAWSPSGEKIAFVSDRSGNFDVWVLNFKGFEAPGTTY